ncbi:COP9 signalosome complex subunit 7a [Apiospora aurea]|uniref:COP9 signalosome complex subunit 7a n=1 Tax=Apiospora aurea TaxID=335848 RepID=A0ABR1QYJ7_9PEZI
MAQVKALNALEPFLALTKSATSPRAAADLVTRATSTPSTYVFAELLQSPQIQALSQAPEYAQYYALLEIFSYGTYSDYRAIQNLPSLNEQQTLKLRQLSLLTLAKDPHNLSYASLLSALGLSDARAVEDLVISAIYADLITAQLDPHNQVVHVSSVSPLRDLAPNSIPAMLASLQDWSSRCTTTLADLEAQIAAIKDTAAQKHSEKKAWTSKTEELIEDEKSSDKGAHGRQQTNMISRAVAGMRSGGRYGKRDRGGNSIEDEADDDEAMDLDDNQEFNEGFEGGLLVLGRSGSTDGKWLLEQTWKL